MRMENRNLDDVVKIPGPPKPEIKEDTQEKCLAYSKIHDLVDGVMELMTYGMCNYDQRVVNCQGDNYQDCRTYLDNRVEELIADEFK